MNLSRYVIPVVLLFIYSSPVIDGKYKILAFMPYNGKSHFYFAEILFEELARRGHDITVVSHYPRKVPLQNYHDISMASEKADGIHSVHIDVINSKSTITKMLDFYRIGLQRVCHEGLSHPNVQQLLKSDSHYDLLITEMFNADCFLGFVHKFKRPFISLRSSTLSTWLGDRTGSPDNPAYVPTTVTGMPSRMTFFKRLQNTFYYVAFKLLYRIYNAWCEEVARQHFGKDMPSLDDIARNTSLYLINTHFLHQLAKPLVPNVKEIAGLHLSKPKPLPLDLENWISAAKPGLVYLSLGSMITASSLEPDKRLAILEALALLPHRVLLKWDGQEELHGLPENVRLSSWLPQNDVLHHPNVKLFITHAGMLGIVESVHAGVPMLAIPFFGDQPTNAALLEERGLGIVLHYSDITFETFNKTLHTLLYDTGYAERAKQMSAAFRDRPMQPLDEAVYWIEYVARHSGTAAENLMRTPALDLALYQYLLLDVLAVVLLGLFTAWMSLRFLGTWSRRLILARRCGIAAEKEKKS